MGGSPSLEEARGGLDSRGRGERSTRARVSVAAPMECPDEDTLLRYLDPGYPEASASHVQVHLDGCATCRQVVAVLARSSGDGRSTSEEAVSGWASDFLPAGVRIG